MALTVVSLKALGDFVIACHALRRVSPGVGVAPDVVAAAYLRPLATAIGFERVRFITTDGPDDVPAAFDIRRRGWAAALNSLVALRRQLADSRHRDPYLFDRVGWRERWLVPAQHRIVLPGSANIYDAYDLALRNAGYALDDTPYQSRGSSRNAIIVPASRMATKTIPSATIGALARVLETRRIHVEAILLEGDRAVVPTNVATTTIPRRFDALIERLKASDLVISADSLAAHLAEFHGVRTFVVSPRANFYWLPASCARSEGWCLFDEADRLANWLEPAGTRRRAPR